MYRSVAGVWVAVAALGCAASAAGPPKAAQAPTAPREPGAALLAPRGLAPTTALEPAPSEDDVPPAASDGAAAPAPSVRPTEPANTAPKASAASRPLHESLRAAEQDAAEAGPAAVIKRLTGAMARLDREAPLDERMRAHGLLAESLGALHQMQRAAAEHEKVMVLWADAAAGTKEILGVEPDDPARLRRLGRALDAVGGALFFRAEQARKRANALRPPAYAGPRNDEAVRRFVATKLKQWVEARRGLVDQAEAKYRKVVELVPAPPPRWVVSSAAGVGDLQAAFAEDFLKVPLPPSVANDPALHSVYQQSLKQALEPQLERAKAAYRLCSAYAQKFQARPELGLQCDAKLARLTGP